MNWLPITVMYHLLQTTENPLPNSLLIQKHCVTPSTTTIRNSNKWYSKYRFMCSSTFSEIISLIRWLASLALNSDCV